MSNCMAQRPNSIFAEFTVFECRAECCAGSTFQLFNVALNVLLVELEKHSARHWQTANSELEHWDSTISSATLKNDECQAGMLNWQNIQGGFERLQTSNVELAEHSTWHLKKWRISDWKVQLVQHSAGHWQTAYFELEHCDTRTFSVTFNNTTFGKYRTGTLR